jgi:hypothetical protein
MTTSRPAGGAPPSAAPRAEIWIRAADAEEWHLAAGRSPVMGCGRRIKRRGSWIWPLRGEGAGPPPADHCAECADAYTRETGRLTLA